MFKHTGHDVILKTINLTVRVFGHLETTSPLDVDKMVNYTQHIMRGPSFKKNNTVLAECKDSAKGVARYQWMIFPTNDVTMERFWTW